MKSRFPGVYPKETCIDERWLLERRSEGRLTVTWKKRGQRVYSYISIRRGDRIHHVYHGSGARGRLAESFMEGARTRRAAAVRQVREFWGRFERGRQLVKQLDAACRRLAEARLLAAGYWCTPCRGWVRRRGAMIEDKLKFSIGGSNPEYLDELIQQGRQGEDAACSALRSELATNSKLWKATGKLAAGCEQEIIDRMAGTDNQKRKSLTRQTKALKARLAGCVASHEEQRLVDWVVQSLLLAWEADTIYPESGECTRSYAVQALSNMVTANHRLFEATVELAGGASLYPRPPARPRYGWRRPDRSKQPVPPVSRLPRA